MQMRISSNKEIQDFLLLKMSNREKLSMTFNNYITALIYAEKGWLVLTGASICISLRSFTIVIGTLVGIKSASISLVFLISNWIIKMFLKTGKKKMLSYCKKNKKSKDPNVSKT